MLSVGERHRFCGSERGDHWIAPGTRLTATFNYPKAAVRDPLNPNGWYLADRTNLRYVDEAKDVVSLVAGSEEAGCIDGIGAEARFSELSGLLITSDGATIWCGDSMESMRRVNTTTREVTSHYHYSISMCWDLAPTIKPESAIYCVTVRGVNDRGVIRRYEIGSGSGGSGSGSGSGDVKEYSMDDRFTPGSLVCTLSGLVIFINTRSEIDRTRSVIVLDPITADMQPLDFVLESDLSDGFVLDDSSRTLICTKANQLISYTLPPQYFLLPKCCDRNCFALRKVVMGCQLRALIELVVCTRAGGLSILCHRGVNGPTRRHP